MSLKKVFQICVYCARSLCTTYSIMKQWRVKIVNCFIGGRQFLTECLPESLVATCYNENTLHPRGFPGCQTGIAIDTETPRAGIYLIVPYINILQVGLPLYTIWHFLKNEFSVHSPSQQMISAASTCSMRSQCWLAPQTASSICPADSIFWLNTRRFILTWIILLRSTVSEYKYSCISCRIWCPWFQLG